MNADVNPPKRKRIRKRERLDDRETWKGFSANTHDQINFLVGMLEETLRLMICKISLERPNYDPDPDDNDNDDDDEDNDDDWDVDELVELLEGIKWLAELAHRGVKGKQPLSRAEEWPKLVKETERQSVLQREVFVPQRILYMEYVKEKGVGKKNATARCVGEALDRAKELGIETTEREVRREGDFDRLLVERNKAERRPKR